MIVIGNGPIPFAHPGSPGPSAGSAGVASRTATIQNGTAPEGTIPAAAPERSGQTASATAASAAPGQVRAVLATSRTEAVVTNPQDLYRATCNASGRAGGRPNGGDQPFPQHLEYRNDPPAPLSSYATIPTEVTAEIQRLRSEIASLKAELAEVNERREAPEAVGESRDVSGPDIAPPEGSEAPAEVPATVPEVPSAVEVAPIEAAEASEDTPADQNAVPQESAEIAAPADDRT